MIITCRQLVEAVTAAMEGALSVLDQVGYRAHLARCAHCRTYVRQMERTVELLREPLDARKAPEELKAALLARLRRGPPKDTD